MDTIWGQGVFSFTLQPAATTELLKCPHLTQSHFNHITTELQCITQHTIFHLTDKSVCKILSLYSNWCVWRI